MPDELIIEHCAPTLAGLKTGSLFNYEYVSKDELLQSLRVLNQCLVPKGIRIVPVRYSTGHALIYMYRPDALAEDLRHETARRMLEACSYPCGNADRCVTRLRSRFTEKQGFPHEIGLFLGYPPEDVKAFVENKGKNYKCVGCWKVYNNEAEAKRLFEAFKKCTGDYFNQIRAGKSIGTLAVKKHDCRNSPALALK